MPTVRKRGKTWQAQVRIKENGKIVYQESATRDTKAAATLWGLQLERQIAATGWRTLAKPAGPTVAQVVGAYRTLRERVKPLGRGMEHSMAALECGELGDLPVADLTPGRMVEWGMKLHAAGNAPATVMHHFSILRAAFNAGHLSDLKVDATPIKHAIAGLKQLRVAAPSRRVDNRVTDEDLAKILPEFGSDTAVIDMRTWVQLAIALPRRREELCMMQRRHLSADGSTIKLIDTKDPRKYREETVPVPPRALEILRGVPVMDGAAGRYFPYKPESVSARWQRAVRRAGLPHLRLHDLRHEGISRLFEAGLSIEEVALISGHTSWATLRRYTHLRPQDVTEKLRNRP
jgi:integrase